jgi:DNA polymerase-3 subunit alpha
MIKKWYVIMLEVKGNGMETVGIVKNVRPLITKNGAAMAFATLDKHKDEIDLVFFPKVWEKCKGYIEDGKEVTLRGEIDYSPIQPIFVVRDCS